MSTTEFKSLDFFERKDYEELKNVGGVLRKRRDREMFMGFFTVTFIAALLVTGVLKVDLSTLGL